MSIAGVITQPLLLCVLQLQLAITTNVKAPQTVFHPPKLRSQFEVILPDFNRTRIPIPLQVPNWEENEDFLPELNDGFLPFFPRFFSAITSTESRMVFEILGLSNLRRLRTGRTQREERIRLFDYCTSSLAHRCYENSGGSCFSGSFAHIQV